MTLSNEAFVKWRCCQFEYSLDVTLRGVFAGWRRQKKHSLNDAPLSI